MARFNAYSVPSLPLTGNEVVMLAQYQNGILQTVSATAQEVANLWESGGVAGKLRQVTGTTDTITFGDNQGNVVYLNSSACAVTLAAGLATLNCKVYALGTGTVTLTATSAAKLNGTTNGYIVLAGNVGYSLDMPLSPNWFLK